MARSADWAARALRTRWLVRAPIHAYRVGLGFLFGQRLLMLEHRGRKSGRMRQVVLEVVAHPTPDRYVVVAGFGERAQWLRNVRADPHVLVSVGRRRSNPAIATELERLEADAFLAEYAEQHPDAWERLRATMEQGLGTEIAALPVVALDLG
jgi:deazaflavin-dependent oxidoreductase (nitroreductase family)